jgi:hypothetical protein
MRPVLLSRTTIRTTYWPGGNWNRFTRVGYLSQELQQAIAARSMSPVLVFSRSMTMTV